MRTTKPTTLRFPTEAALVSWLLSDAGRPALEAASKGAIDDAIRRDRRHVLIVLDAETLDVYASGKGVAVLVQTLLQGDDSDRTAREEYLRQTIPLGWRKMFRLKNHVQTASYRQPTPEMELEAVNRRIELNLLKESGLWPPPKPTTKPRASTAPHQRPSPKPATASAKATAPR